MPSLIDFYFSFRSPYSYLATPDALKLEEDFDVTVCLRPVLPLAIRQPEFFNPDNIKRAKYILKDWPRRAEMLGLPHAWPSPDPIVQDLSTFEIAKDQPYIFRLNYLALEAQRRGRGVSFAAEVSRLIFSGTKDWNLGDHLAAAVKRAGLDLASLEDAIRDPQSFREELDSNQAQLEKSGHWGVPTYVFESEPFFGQDRIDSLRWHLEKNGLKKTL